jgi:peptidoglycan/xylan/chitin deacetylase (PgdA/CDA1 family)
LNNEEIEQFIKDGWNIDSHGATHTNLDISDSNILLQEIMESKKKLRKRYHVNPPFFAYPNGKYSTDSIKEIKKAGYKAAFSMDDGFITNNTNRYAIPRVGVMGTHTLNEFPYIYAPHAVLFRKVVKQVLPNAI